MSKETINITKVAADEVRPRDESIEKTVKLKAT